MLHFAEGNRWTFEQYSRLDRDASRARSRLDLHYYNPCLHCVHEESTPHNGQHRGCCICSGPVGLYCHSSYPTMSSGNLSSTKLTALTTSTLSLLLERQRLQATHPTLHLQQITSNLRVIRSGVIAAQSQEDDAVSESLRGQYERMIGMLGVEEAEGAGLER